MSDIDEVALETARKIYRINMGRAIGGKPQYIAMIQCAVRDAIEQAARAQGGEVEPVGYVSGEALENLKRGHPVHAYAPDTPLVFGSKAWIYTHPPAPTQGVPEGWKLVPIESTINQRKAAWDAHVCSSEDADAVYNAMLNAAPEAPNHPSGEWVRCSNKMPSLGQRVILKSRGVVQNYMPTLDQSDMNGFGGDGEFFWNFDGVIADEDYPLVDLENDEWTPQPPKDNTQEGSGDE